MVVPKHKSQASAGLATVLRVRSGFLLLGCSLVGFMGSEEFAAASCQGSRLPWKSSLLSTPLKPSWPAQRSTDVVKGPFLSKARLGGRPVKEQGVPPRVVAGKSGNESIASLGGSWARVV